MQRITSYLDLKKYLEANPIQACWYGPRSSDMSDLDNIIQLTGIISCYGSDFAKDVPSNIYEKPGERKKFSIDNLAGYFMTTGQLNDYVGRNKITTILPYDSNEKLERFCKENHTRLLSSSDQIKDELRDKTKIDEISRAIGLPAIPGKPGIIDDFEFEPLANEFGLPLFLHFAEGAGGTGNRIAYTQEEFEKVKLEQKGKRLNAKKYFVGKTCTIDICVTPTSVICGTLEEELIGAEPLNSNPTEYVASSWFENNYTYEMRKKISDIGVALGEYVRSRGFLGCFHPDFLIGDKDEIFITELNMRFGGSCGAYTKIQTATGQIPILALHALAFIDSDIEFDSEKINEENLKPLDYDLLVLKNNFGKPVTISHQYKSGVYAITENGIAFRRKAKFAEFKGGNDIFISGLPESGEDTIVDKGAYMCEVMTRFPVSDSKSKLNAEGKELVEKIYSQLTT